ncbi:hypothetical protein [Peribacillus butanolivorans]|uniref:hypothetical protein n=1 Tax=Peribacillus butanolivorans TaxID=421767 RepID=UPI000B1C730A|nr:hypothetical protein [Peribacillus butanolivorans]
MAKMGRPKKPEYRSVRLRFGKVEDQLLEIIESLEDEKEKQLARNILERLKPVT